MGDRNQFLSRNKLIIGIGILFAGLSGAAVKTATQASTASPSQQPAQQQNPSQQNPAQISGLPPAPSKTGPNAQQATPGATTKQYPLPAASPGGLDVVVLDPAHGGTDPGARGTGGIRESDLVLELADQVRSALEAQGFQVLQTRTGNDDPSLDDRSAMANAQTGAVFISLHIASTGLPQTVRTYVMSDMPAAPNPSGLILWDQAQAPYLPLSHLLGDAVQQQLALIFHGSPNTALSAAVRQLRTTAAPAIAVELSSVAVQDPSDLEQMMPGVADAIARGVVAFRPLYVTPAQPGAQP